MSFPKPAPRKKVSKVYWTTSWTRHKARSYGYVLLRYDEILEEVKRKQPRTLVNLGPEQDVDRNRASSLAGVMQEFVRKGSTMTEEELRERLGMVKPKLRIMCSRQFGLRLLVEQAFAELSYTEILREIAADTHIQYSLEQAVFDMVLQQIICPGPGLSSHPGAHLGSPHPGHL